MSWDYVIHSTHGFLLIFHPSMADASTAVTSEHFLYSSFRFYFDFLTFSLSFLVSGNLENNSRMKLLEEISYFDGDASAVTSDLTNNVDVNSSSY